MNQAYLYGFIALFLCVAGVLFLRVSWRKQRPVLMTSGWLLLVVSAALWSVYAGIEYGLSYTLMAISFAAWLLIGFNTTRQATKNNSSTIDLTTLPATTTWHKWGTLLVAGPLSAVSSLLVCAFVIGSLADDSNRGNAMVLTAFVFPLVWSVIAVWVCATDRLARASCILFAAGAASSVSLIL